MQSDKFRSGQRVTLATYDEPGTIVKVRHDDRDRAIYTVKLDDPTFAEGIYYARDEELHAL